MIWDKNDKGNWRGSLQRGHGIYARTYSVELECLHLSTQVQHLESKNTINASKKFSHPCPIAVMGVFLMQSWASSCLLLLLIVACVLLLVEAPSLAFMNFHVICLVSCVFVGYLRMDWYGVSATLGT